MLIFSFDPGGRQAHGRMEDNTRVKSCFYFRACQFNVTINVLWSCGGSMQSFRRSLRKWPDVYTCALVCALSRHLCVWGVGDRAREK